jgi:hypothetical protein
MVDNRARHAPINFLCRAYKEAPHQARISMPQSASRIDHTRCTMRNNWILTPAETVIFIAGMTLLAGGAMWAGIG